MDARARRAGEPVGSSCGGDGSRAVVRIGAAQLPTGRPPGARVLGESHRGYRRHDDVTDPQILRSLWGELTSATHCLVDLTGRNPNVTLELGIADALGTPTLLGGQPGTGATLFPMIRRARVTEYATTAELELACGRFVAGSGDAGA